MENNKVSFDDLITKQYLKAVDIEIHGIGTVTLHQQSASDMDAMIKGGEGLEDDALELYISRCALKFVKNEDVTDEELEAFRKLQSAKAISTIYTEGLTLTPPPVDLESAEKN